ncbi:YveK family protein [Clostridium tarantellae]|uniref:Capsular biosynthesis protein n=1 Tax=Clostridium tarantellae TaxID=39493 RepID=A0A6I1MIQ8_9CLOT|nr:GNVR domain-containing protein [Clostridium tarantellae]MPQ43426.1 capsular biosynthesis protein [Clostridium tarantellae]
MGEQVISFNDIFKAIKKRWKLMVILTVLLTIASGIISFFVIKPQYEGIVKLFIGKEQSSSSEKGYDNNDVMMYQNLIKTYAEVVQTSDLITNAMKNNNINKQTSEILAGLTVVPRADTQILEIKFKSGNKEEVVSVLNAISDEFMHKANELVENGNVQVIQKAEIPTSPVSPNKLLNMVIAFILGIMISLGIIFLLEYLDNTFKSRKDVENYFNIPVIGAIPKQDEL